MIARIQVLAVLTAALVMAGCTDMPGKHHTVPQPAFFPAETLGPPVIRQPVLPEMLVPCRGHVLVPALGMTFVRRNAPPPETGEFLREESLSAPYRIISPGDHFSPEQSPARLNVELDRAKRIIGLYCG